MKSKSISGNSTEEIKTALQKSLTEDFKPTIAIAFISIKQDEFHFTTNSWVTLKEK